MLKRGDCLIASARGALADVELLELRNDLADGVGQVRGSSRLRGADAVVVGIQPDVAFSMVRLGLRVPGVLTALDLEDALAEVGRARTPIGVDAG